MEQWIIFSLEGNRIFWSFTAKIENTGFKFFHYCMGRNFYLIGSQPRAITYWKKKPVKVELLLSRFLYCFYLSCACVLGLVHFFRWNRDSLCFWWFQPCWHFAGQCWEQPWLHVDYLGLETRRDSVEVKSFCTGCLQGHVFCWEWRASNYRWIRTHQVGLLMRINT